MTNLFLLMNVVLICYTISNAYTKELTNGPDALSFLEFCVYRSFMQALISAIMVVIANRSSKTKQSLCTVPKDCRIALISRCLVGTATFYLTSIPLKLIPISIYQAVLCTIPLWTGIVQWLWLKIPVDCA